MVRARVFVHEGRSTAKLAAKARESILIGFCTNSKDSGIYNSSTWRVRESRNVVFIELVPRLVQLTVAGGDAVSDFLVGTVGADTLAFPGVNISITGAGDISNGDSVYYDTFPDITALQRDYDI